jgi:hypothetical protein
MAHKGFVFGLASNIFQINGLKISIITNVEAKIHQGLF